MLVETTCKPAPGFSRHFVLSRYSLSLNCPGKFIRDCYILVRFAGATTDGQPNAVEHLVQG